MPPSPSQPARAATRPAAGVPHEQPAALPAIEIRRSSRCLMRFDSQLSPAIVERLWSAADELLASGHMLKDGDRCTVVRIEAPNPIGTDQVLTLKRYNLKDRVHTAVHALLRSRAMWGWVNGRQLVAAGIPTPIPMACVEERGHGLLRRRSFLLTTFVPGRSLLDVIADGKAAREQLVDLASQFASLWQKLGQLRAGHGDMKATNFIVGPGGRLWLIDLDGMRRYRSAMWLRRERRNDLSRFMRNWQQYPGAAAIFRARIGTG